MRRHFNHLAFIATVFAVWILFAPTGLGGAVSYVIVDGSSMQPTYVDGDLVISRQKDDYGTGDVITYDAPVDASFRVIHRIVDRADGGFITRGDNRDDNDGWIAPNEAIHGASWLHIPRGGTVIEFVRQPSTVLAVVAGWIAFGLLSRREERELSEGNSDESTDRHHSPEQRPESQTAVSTAPDSRTDSRRERRQLVAFITVGALVGLLGAAFAANASVLHVNGGTLQYFADLPTPPSESEEPDPEEPGPEEPESFAISVRVHGFNSGNPGNRPGGGNAGGELGNSPTTFSYAVPEGSGYTLGWSGADDAVVSCDDESITFSTRPNPQPSQSGPTGSDPVVPDGDLVHELCVQTPGKPSVSDLDFAVIAQGGTTSERPPTADESFDDADPQDDVVDVDKADDEDAGS